MATTSNIQFKGIYLPIITPFKENGDFDQEGYTKLIHHYIDAGITGLVPCGTTGESPTLSHEEHRKVIEIAVAEAAGKIPVIPGTGSNSTKEAIAITQHAEKAGANGALVVCPYYNRPSQEGIVRHFTEVAKNTKLPIIIYNIPTRTGRNIEPATIIELSKIPNIAGLKDCSMDLGQLMTIVQGTKDFSILTGEDCQIFVTMCLGGHGAIAASSHIATEEFLKIVPLVEQGKIEEARAVHYKLLPLVGSLFCEPNPAPVKAAVELLGLPAGPPRLPLLPASQQCKERLKGVLGELGFSV